MKLLNVRFIEYGNDLYTFIENLYLLIYGELTGVIVNYKAVWGALTLRFVYTISRINFD